jgi:hypothetical protein
VLEHPPVYVPSFPRPVSDEDMDDTPHSTEKIRSGSSPDVASGVELGIPVSTELLSMFSRLVVAVETIAASVSSGSAGARHGVDERIDLVLQAIQAFGNMVPTYAQLAKETGIAASTLNGMPAVRDALRKARDHVKSDRRTARSFKNGRTGAFDAWIDPEDAE